MRKVNCNPAGADGNIGALVLAMSRGELAALWQRRWRRVPPKGLSRRLLECNAAWLLQADAQGGLAAATRRHLEALSRSAQSSDRSAVSDKGHGNADQPVARKTLRPGSRLVRRWRGRSHVVEVVDGGFTCEGRQYTSLTAIAREITGTQWSGPRFFGLNAPTSGKRPSGKQHPPGAVPGSGSDE